MDKRGIAIFLVILVFCTAIYGLLGTVSLTVVMTPAGKSKSGLHFVHLGTSDTGGALPQSDSRATLYCRLKHKVPFSTMTRTLKALQRHRDHAYFPEESLENMVHFNSCAVVSSSHAMKYHHYGKEIDAHDAVLRFSCAPTKNYSVHVGRRTDIRLNNAIVMEDNRCEKQFWDKHKNLFNNEIIVVRNNLKVRRDKLNPRHDAHHSFDNYIKYRKAFPNRRMYFIQRPGFGADIKEEQSHFCNQLTSCKKTDKGPSTGAHGVVMMMHLCDWVYTYEFIPSTVDRATPLAHYFDEVTNFTWAHSYVVEREYWRALTITPLAEVDKTGVAVLRGLSQYNCT